MGKRSIKENKNIYFRTREEAGLTRAQASEIMSYVTESRLEKIENEKTAISPSDVVAMAEAYKKPGLCNYFCTHECPIGITNIEEVPEVSLSEISLSILSALNSLEKKKNRLIEITEDGQMTEDEYHDFMKIQEDLEKLALTTESLKLWINTKAAEGVLDKDKYENSRI